MFQTGNATVDAIGQINLEGNVIPHRWFDHIKFDNGKPDLTAIIILSEIVYWYRPFYVKDEATGSLIGLKKRFKADLLQRSYDSFANQFGITKRQATEAIRRLEAENYVKRHFRTLDVNGTKLNNVLFIELLHEKLISMTFQGDSSHIETSGVSHPNVTPPTPKRQTNTEITTENTTEKKKNSRKQVYDESSVHYQLANLLAQKILADDAGFKQPDLQVWADHIRLMMDKDGRTEEQVRYLIEWSQANPFWKANILSARKLRDKATTLIRQIQSEKKGDRAYENNKRSNRTAESTFGVTLDF